MDTSTNQDVMAMPRIGDVAPEFQAVTTQGNINFPSDYKGTGLSYLAIRQILPQYVPRSL